MELIQQVALSFPVIVFTVLWSLMVMYWLLVVLRLAPLELFERDSIKGDHLASTMVALGFAGVPVSFALSVLMLLAGVITMAVELLVLRGLTLGFFRVPIGIALLWIAFALASPLTNRLCQAFHHRFHRHAPLQHRCLLGEKVTVESDADRDGWARAVLVSDPECRVWLHGKPDNMPQAGEPRVLVKFIASEQAYRSVAEKAFRESRAHLKRLKLKHSRFGPQETPLSR